MPVNRDAVEHQGNINSSKAGSKKSFKTASIKKGEESQFHPIDL